MPHRLAQLLILALLVAGAAGGNAARAGSKAPPNIVLIISDDHAWTDYGFMGHPTIKTPHLDRLAAQSLTFTRGYVPSSLCCPSLASILTGRYPHQHRITSNDPPMPAGMTNREFQGSAAFRDGREQMNRYMEQTPGLPRLLGERGYLSLQTGKWWQGAFRRGGFTHGMTKGGRHGDEGLKIGRETMQPIYDFIEEAGKQGKPFFVWYAPMLPHTPHDPPERLLAKYRSLGTPLPVAKYHAMVEWFDETCGQLLDQLEKKGLAENTIVAYAADNGWLQDPTASQYAPRSKQSPYEGGLRTPIMLRWPGRIKPQRSGSPATSLDLAPTLLKAIGAKASREMPGVNLLDTSAIERRKRIFGECFTHNAIDLARPAANLRWRWVLEGDRKLIVPAPQNEKGTPELFDLATDPHEKRDLAAKEPERVRRLTKLLDAWWPGTL
jgi:arylsulfatase A-like enzyme